jgi:hypothetical protein
MIVEIIICADRSDQIVIMTHEEVKLAVGENLQYNHHISYETKTNK